GDRAVTAKYLPIDETQAASVEGNLLIEIDRFATLGSANMVGDLQNRLAMEYLAVGAYDYAVEFFEKAMRAKQEANQTSDLDAIGHNLAVTYEFMGELAKAYSLRKELYDKAVKARNS